ncbi:hypothetical protein [Microbacterium testaceum]|uniref:hypothetical protein n=1 Tax=Microbacterium testaceum TaxID=2033 RepID=UPI002AC456C9|nr:hypothetical protein [Microbacterium testaceum]MDZ5145666.1 hypothetical protein [Microbacterium testaceum]
MDQTPVSLSATPVPTTLYFPSTILTGYPGEAVPVSVAPFEEIVSFAAGDVIRTGASSALTSAGGVVALKAPPAVAVIWYFWPGFAF